MSKKTILVVDSQPKTREMLVNKLRDLGNPVTFTDSITEADDLVSHYKFDLVIVEADVDPIKINDGVEWARLVCIKVPVIVFSINKPDFSGLNIKWCGRLGGYGDLLEFVSKM